MKKLISMIILFMLCFCLTMPASAEAENQITISYPGTDVKIILSDAFIVGRRTWTSMSLWNGGPFESTWIIAKPGCTITFSHSTFINAFNLNGDSGTEYNSGIAQLYKPETYRIEDLFSEMMWRDYDMLELWPQDVIDMVGSMDSYCISMTYAILSPQKLSIDGEYQNVEKYNINDNNYFKLRDIAYLLKDTSARFSVYWDGSSVWINTGEPYTPNGMELTIGEDKSISARRSEQFVYINGELRTDLTVYYLMGNNFFKLRDLGEALGFSVEYDGSTNTAVVATK